MYHHKTAPLIYLIKLNNHGSIIELCLFGEDELVANSFLCDQMGIIVEEIIPVPYQEHKIKILQLN